jgi:hypothetical protein
MLLIFDINICNDVRTAILIVKKDMFKLTFKLAISLSWRRFLLVILTEALSARHLLGRASGHRVRGVCVPLRRVVIAIFLVVGARLLRACAFGLRLRAGPCLLLYRRRLLGRLLRLQPYPPGIFIFFLFLLLVLPSSAKASPSSSWPTSATTSPSSS